jgi:hypothetical protein
MTRTENILMFASLYDTSKDRAIAQAVSRWLPTAAAQVRAKVSSCGICGGQSGTGAGFLRILRFHLSSFFPPTAPYSSRARILMTYKYLKNDL